MRPVAESRDARVETGRARVGAGGNDRASLRSTGFRKVAAPDAPPDDGAHLGLKFWRSETGAGGFAYLDVAGFRVTAGAPRGPADRLSALFAEFARDCEAKGLRRVHFGMPGPMLEFIEGPVARVHVGDLPMFDLARWRAEATMPAAIRAQARRARNHGVTVRHLDAPAERGSLRACRNAWLRAKPLPPMGFATTPFLFDPWPSEGVFIAEREGGIVGFLSSSRALFGEVLRVDAVGRAPGAPNGCAELLVAEAFRRASGRGIARATLGLAPLSRRSGARDPGASGAAFRALSGLSRRLVSPLYSFTGLESFKAKFAPDAWIPLYCVAPGRFFGPRDAWAVARAFAGGLVSKYALRALAWKAGNRDVRGGEGSASLPP